MEAGVHLVTGATGLLGSHLVEALLQHGLPVRALVRPTSDTGHLDRLGVEKAVGDLTDPQSLQQAMAGVAVVYHCASKVGDWGPWREFQRHIVDATANVVRAASDARVRRLVFISSVQVYGRPELHQPPITETSPLGLGLRRWEKYARSKIEAEKLVQRGSVEWAILRPSWIYGPRDRQTLPRIVNGLRVGRMGLIGRGEHLLNLVFASDVAQAAVQAGIRREAAGQAYNLSSPGEITQREWFDLITEAVGLPPVRRSLSPRWAYRAGWFSEVVGKLIGLRRSPYVTRYGVGLMLRPTIYSSDKAKAHLDWQIATPVREGMRQTLEWYRANYIDQA